MVVITPADALEMKSATMSPLTARNAARGLSERRRPAMSRAGRLVRRAMIREMSMVSHGPAMTSPAMASTKPAP